MFRGSCSGRIRQVNLTRHSDRRATLQVIIGDTRDPFMFLALNVQVRRSPRRIISSQFIQTALSHKCPLRPKPALQTAAK